MKNLINVISRIMMLASVTAVLIVPISMRDAWAGAGVNDCTTVIITGNSAEDKDFCIAATDAKDKACTWKDPADPTDTTAKGMCTPEMSDYLAAAFLLIAGGMVYHFRRQATAKA